VEHDCVDFGMEKQKVFFGPDSVDEKTSPDFLDCSFLEMVLSPGLAPSMAV